MVRPTNGFESRTSAAHLRAGRIRELLLEALRIHAVRGNVEPLIIEQQGALNRYKGSYRATTASASVRNSYRYYPLSLRLVARGGLSTLLRIRLGVRLDSRVVLIKRWTGRGVINPGLSNSTTPAGFSVAGSTRCKSSNRRRTSRIGPRTSYTVRDQAIVEAEPTFSRSRTSG